MRKLLILLVGLLPVMFVAACPKPVVFFPNCTDAEPCPPCSDNAQYPDPCAQLKRDGAADSTTDR